MAKFNNLTSILLATELIQQHKLFSKEFMKPKLKEQILDLLQYLGMNSYSWSFTFFHYFKVIWTDMERHNEFMEEFLHAVKENKRLTENKVDIKLLEKNKSQWNFGVLKKTRKRNK